MRHVADDRHGRRLRALIVVLWRGGLRIQEALALAEHDLDPRRGSLLVRNGKGGRRREVGMDDWGWEQLRPWLTERAGLPVGPLFCIIDGPTRGRPWSGAAVRGELRPVRRSGGGQASLRAAPTAPRTRARTGPRGVPLNIIQRTARARQPRHDLHLLARDRPRGDHRRRPRPEGADDVGQRRVATLSDCNTSGSAPALPLRPPASGRLRPHTRDDRASSNSIARSRGRPLSHLPQGGSAASGGPAARRAASCRPSGSPTRMSVSPSSGLFGVRADQVGVAETPRPESAMDAWRVQLVRCRAFSGAEARSGG
jgi:hypothetical protein